MNNGVPLPMRTEADFRGTITYASLNAHLKLDLSRRDDIWSYYFMIMEFFNEKMPWKNYSTKDDVKDVKMKCLSDPERFLWTS